MSSGGAWGGGYSFTNIADSTGAFTFAMSSPSISDSGALAFSAYAKPAPGKSGDAAVLVARGGTLSTVARSILAPSQVAVNSQDAVAFVGNGGTDDNALFSATSVGALYLADSRSCCAFAINDAGDIAYSTGSDGAASIVVDRHGRVDVIGQVPAGADVRGVSINRAGTVAYTTNVEGAGGKLYVGSKTSPVAVVAADPHGSFGAPVVNNRGAVAFLCSDYAAICLVERGARSVVVAASDKFDFLAGDPSMNDAGVIAYSAVKYIAGDAHMAIYTTAQQAPVVATGDPLFGSTLKLLLGTGATSLNNRGQIAFEYELADGRRGVARADPAR